MIESSLICTESTTWTCLGHQAGGDQAEQCSKWHLLCGCGDRGDKSCRVGGALLLLSSAEKCQMAAESRPVAVVTHSTELVIGEETLVVTESPS